MIPFHYAAPSALVGAENIEADRKDADRSIEIPDIETMPLSNNPIPRRFLRLVSSISLLTAFACSATPDVRVILLGTGGPELSPHRQGYATLVEIGDDLLLFDTGRGVLQRLYESGIDPTRIDRIFFTHLHNDHIEGLPNLWMTPWFLLGRDHGFELWGPVGLERSIAGMKAMYHFDLTHRVNSFNDPNNLACEVHTIKEESLILDTLRYSVTAFPVEHGDGNPALGYAIHGMDWTIVLSGDCTYSSKVVEYGKDADIIVHNVIALSPPLAAKPEMQGVLAKLATPEAVARVFTEAKPKLGVLSHIVKKELSGAEGDSFIEAAIREAGYDGPLLIGEDRMILTLGEQISITPPPAINDLPDLDKKPLYTPTPLDQSP